MSDETNDSKLAELEAKLTEQADRIAELSRESAKWRRQAQGKDVPEEVQRRIDDLEEKLSQANADKAEATKALKTATKTAEDATKRAEAAEVATTKLLADNALVEALAKAGITNPAHQKAVRAMFASDVQVVAEGEGRVAKIGDKSVVEALTAWAGTDEGKHFVSAPNTTGGGSQGGHGANTNSNGTPALDDRAARVAEFNRRIAANPD